MTVHLPAANFDGTLCRAYISYDYTRNEQDTYDVDVAKSNCDHCKGVYRKLTNNHTFTTVAEVEYVEPHDNMTFLLENGEIVVISLRDLAGPGVWRRVLWSLELQGGKDIAHLMPAWTWEGLIGRWHY